MRLVPTRQLLVLVFALAACSSEEEQICRREMTFDDYELVMRFGAKKPTPEEQLKDCVESFAELRRDLELDDAGYAEFKRCRGAATSVSASFECRFKAGTAKLKTGMDAAKAKMDEAVAKLEKEGDDALAKLEALVPGGAIDAAMIAGIRANRAMTPPGRLTAIVEDARAVIEAGRVAPGQKMTIQLPPGLDKPMKRPGAMAAELVFVDAKTARTVARIAPIVRGQFGSKNDDIASLLAWLCEDPDHRDVELEVLPGGAVGITFDPPAALAKAIPALIEAGVDQRPMIRVNGAPVTVDEWVKNHQ